MGVAWLFPGQGSQAVGMGKELARRYPRATRVFEEANDALAIDLRALCFEGPAEAIDVASRAGCVFAVRSSSSAGPSKQSARRSIASASFASSKTRVARG